MVSAGFLRGLQKHYQCPNFVLSFLAIFNYAQKDGGRIVDVYDSFFY